MLILILILGGLNTILLVALILKKGSRKDVSNGAEQSRTESLIKEEMLLNRRELSETMKNNSDSLDKRLAGIASNQAQAIMHLGDTVEKRLMSIQKDNTVQLEKMRVTVDEKLQSTLEKRLGESFKHVSERLEQVHKGLGEMQTLASGVGDLKKVLTNVKTRGTWGEIQLESLLSQILTREQYEKNVIVSKGASERVEFAIKIPAKDDKNGVIWLPIDAKFPLEDYHRLIEAQEAARVEDVAASVKMLEQRIKAEAKKIREKYIHPPETTDFALLYLPIEGLYAEVTQRPELIDYVQQNYRVMIAGPHSVAALLNSLQMGFRTLAIEKRTSEVWEALGAVRSEFGTFGDLLEKTKQKLEQATKTIDDASVRTRKIERHLDKVQTLDPGTTAPEKLIDVQ